MLYMLKLEGAAPAGFYIPHRVASYSSYPASQLLPIKSHSRNKLNSTPDSGCTIKLNNYQFTHPYANTQSFDAELLLAAF